MKTIDIQISEWVDRTYGNTYYSSEIIVDYGTENAKRYIIPFQYGYGSHAEYKSLELIKEVYKLEDISSNVIVRTYKKEVKKRDLHTIKGLVFTYVEQLETEQLTKELERVNAGKLTTKKASELYNQFNLKHYEF